MLISELIQRLLTYQREHGDLAIVCSKDSEGNAYHMLDTLDVASAEDLSEYYIELVDVDGETPINCVVIWP